MTVRVMRLFEADTGRASQGNSAALAKAIFNPDGHDARWGRCPSLSWRSAHDNNLSECNRGF